MDEAFGIDVDGDLSVGLDGLFSDHSHLRWTFLVDEAVSASVGDSGSASLVTTRLYFDECRLCGDETGVDNDPHRERIVEVDPIGTALCARDKRSRQRRTG